MPRAPAPVHGWALPRLEKQLETIEEPRGFSASSALSLPRGSPLDLVARLDDSERIKQAVSERGYALAGSEPPLSFELVDSEGHQVDVHPASFTASVDGVTGWPTARTGSIPLKASAASAASWATKFPAWRPRVVMTNHTTGYALDDVHQKDVMALNERYGIPLPKLRTDSGPQSKRKVTW
jgi:hypothetical protein